MKKLIVNADDFGMTEGINQGIIAAHRDGIVTSTSLMVLRKTAAHAVGLASNLPRLGLGLHVEFPQKIYERWLRNSDFDVDLTKAVIGEQIEMFEDLTGFLPDHIDCHKIVIAPTTVYPILRHEGLWTALDRIWQEKATPYRGIQSIHAVGEFHGARYDPATNQRASSAPEWLTPTSLMKILYSLPDGISEIICHPALFTDDLESTYRYEREIEFDTLTSSLIRDAVKSLGISLITYGHINPNREKGGAQ